MSNLQKDGCFDIASKIWEKLNKIKSVWINFKLI